MWPFKDKCKSCGVKKNFDELRKLNYQKFKAYSESQYSSLKQNNSFLTLENIALKSRIESLESQLRELNKELPIKDPNN